MEQPAHVTHRPRVTEEALIHSGWIADLEDVQDLRSTRLVPLPHKLGMYRFVHATARTRGGGGKA